MSNPDVRPQFARMSSRHAETKAHVLDDGRFSVHMADKAQRLAKHLQKKPRGNSTLGQEVVKRKRRDNTDYKTVLGRYAGVLRISIAIHIVGSRGDVQPFIAIGQVLSKPPYSHRVRICTHAVFKDFVEENGLEFFSIGGDPATLMAYMVKNPGLMPGMDSLKAGDVGKRRKDIAEMLEGFWRSCIEPGNGMEKHSTGEDGKTSSDEDADKLFVADAIIANPPSYAHLHCAERLGIPLHMMFTMPWSPTQSFPHPLASMERSDVDAGVANYISYTMMELLAWQGLGDVINGFRVKTLRLDPISPLWGHMLLARMRVPFTYCWSQALISKPQDWGPHIRISGFSFLNLASSYEPPPDLVSFLQEEGPPIVYIGFGSIVVDKPNELTTLIFNAAKRARVRALVSKGWGGFGGDNPPEGVYLLGNCPHDWLFQYVSCVVHHGGAGTTAIGVAMGKPTVVVPFFGDQPFWGAMICRAGAGPEPVPYKKMTEETLARSITTALNPDIQIAAKSMGEKIRGETGAVEAANNFQGDVDIDSMRCMLSPEHIALWRLKNTNLRLSGLAVAILLNEGHIKGAQLKLVRHRNWYVDEGAEDPFIGTVAAVSGTLTSIFVSIRDYTSNVSRYLKKRDPESTTSRNPQPDLAHYPLDEVASRVQVRPVASYPPHYLEAVAHRMASKTLPDGKSRSTHQKTHSWSPTKTGVKESPQIQTARRHDSLAKKWNLHVNEEHGRWYDVTTETGRFAYEIFGTGLRAPVAFFYNLANGFHNAPSYFHDETVRRRDNITGFGSGLKVAGKEFGLGLYDGISGLVTQPYRGARKKGVLGFGKGIGKGLGGLVCKSGAAAFGLPGYTLKGLEKQLQKRSMRDVKARILVVRIKQGIRDFERASEREKEGVLRRWNEVVRDQRN